MRIILAALVAISIGSFATPLYAVTIPIVNDGTVVVTGTPANLSNAYFGGFLNVGIGGDVPAFDQTTFGQFTFASVFVQVTATAFDKNGNILFAPTLDIEVDNCGPCHRPAYPDTWRLPYQPNVAKFVMTSTSNAYTTAPNNIFAEYQFDLVLPDGVAAVPEPSTWAMLLAGFLALATTATIKRRRGKAAISLH